MPLDSFLFLLFHLGFCVHHAYVRCTYLWKYRTFEKKTMVGVRMTKLFVEMFAAYMISCMKAGRWCVRRTEKQMKWNEANEFRLKQHKNTNIHVHTHIHSSRFMAYTQKAVLYWMVRSRDWSWGKAICIKDYCIETERSGDLLAMCVCIWKREWMTLVREHVGWAVPYVNSGVSRTYSWASE